MARTVHSVTKVLLAAVLLGVLVVAPVRARFDSSFGVRGTALGSLPEDPWQAGIYDMAQDGRGRLLVIGGISPRGGERLWERMLTARFGRDGTLDTSFGVGGFAPARLQAASGIAVQKDGKAVVVGFSNEGKSPDINRRYATAIARFDSNGDLDRSFHGGYVTRWIASVARDVAIQDNGRIVVAGIKVESFQSKGIVFALKPNGDVDRSFGRRGRVAIFAPDRILPSTDLTDIVIQPDGKLLVVGAIEGRILLARLFPDGGLDPGFGGGDGRVAVQFSPRECACSSAHAVRLQSDGRIVVLAHEFRGGRAVIVTRFLPDGQLDRSFGPRERGFVRHSNSYALGLAVQQNDKLVVAGETIGAQRNFMVLRYLPDGGLDRSFGSAGVHTSDLGASSFATSALAEPSGRVVVAGTRLRSAGERNIVLQRFEP